MYLRLKTDARTASLHEQVEVNRCHVHRQAVHNAAHWLLVEEAILHDAQHLLEVHSGVFSRLAGIVHALNDHVYDNSALSLLTSDI